MLKAEENMKESQKSSFSPLLHLTYVLQQLSDERLLSRVGVGLSQTRIMSVLNDSIPRSQRAIAHILQQTEANVSRQLKVMHHHGLVSIVKSKNDARQRDVKLTAKGNNRYLRAVTILSKQQNEFFKLLNKNELKSFEHATANLLTALNVKANSSHKTLR
jgi:DNA-binding MarR family transcriptional regulator